MHKRKEIPALNRLFPLPRPTDPALRLLTAQLALTALWALAILLELLSAYPLDPLAASMRYATHMEYIAVSLVIAVGSSVLVDLVRREQEQEKK